MGYSVNTGNVDTSDPTSDTIPRSVRNTMAYLDEDNTQFTTMLMRMPEETTHHYKTEWPEDQLLPQHTALSASCTNSATTLNVTSNEGEIARPGDVGRICSTGEGFIITTVGASAWTVVRGFGGVSGATAASGAKVVIVGNMNEQNAAAPTAVITARTVSYNYSGIFRDTLDVAGTTEVLNLYGEPEGLFRSEKRKKLLEHKWRQERSIFFGARGYTTGPNGKPWTSAGGAIEFITTNRVDISGSLTRAELQDTLRTALQYGNRRRKVMFCGPLVAQLIGSFLQDNWVRATPSDKVWGVSVDYVVSAAFAGAQIPVVVKGDWMRFGEGSAREYGSSGFIIDMDHVSRLPLVRNGVNRDTHFRDNIQNPDVDGHKAEYLTEVTYRFSNEKAHTYFYNALYAT